MNLRMLTNAVNAGGRAAGRTGMAFVSLEPAALLAEARRRTGLEDFGAPALEEPFRRLMASYETEARLTLVGRIAARQDTLRLLENRLAMEADRRRHA